LITGASGGIGKALAYEFAKAGNDLILSARNQAKLKEVAADIQSTYNVDVQIEVADLATADGAEKLYQSVQKKKLVVENLINNAGFGNQGEFVKNDFKKEVELMQVNTLSVIELCHLFLQGMIERKSGSILNVASTAAFQPGPYMATYFASKAAVLSFSEAIATELKPYNISVTALCPGPVATSFFDAAEMAKTNLAQSPHMTTADKVAKIGFNGWRKKKMIIVPGFLNKLMAFSVRISPRSVVKAVAARMNQ